MSFASLLQKSKFVGLQPTQVLTKVGRNWGLKHSIPEKSNFIIANCVDDPIQGSSYRTAFHTASMVQRWIETFPPMSSLDSTPLLSLQSSKSKPPSWSGLSLSEWKQWVVYATGKAAEFKLKVKSGSLQPQQWKAFLLNELTPFDYSTVDVNGNESVEHTKGDIRSKGGHPLTYLTKSDASELLNSEEPHTVYASVMNPETDGFTVSVSGFLGFMPLESLPLNRIRTLETKAKGPLFKSREDATQVTVKSASCYPSGVEMDLSERLGSLHNFAVSDSSSKKTRWHMPGSTFMSHPKSRNPFLKEPSVPKGQNLLTLAAKDSKITAKKMFDKPSFVKSS